MSLVFTLVVDISSYSLDTITLLMGILHVHSLFYPRLRFNGYIRLQQQPGICLNHGLVLLKPALAVLIFICDMRYSYGDCMISLRTLKCFT